MKFLMTYAQNPNVPPPTPEKMAEIGAFAERNIRSGVVVMTGGLVRPSRGAWFASCAMSRSPRRRRRMR